MFFYDVQYVSEHFICELYLPTVFAITTYKFRVENVQED